MRFPFWFLWPGLPLAAFVAALAWVAVVIIRKALREAATAPGARRREMRALAGQLGIKFAEGPEELVQPLCLNTVPDRVRNILRGRSCGRDCCCSRRVNQLFRER